MPAVARPAARVKYLAITNIPSTGSVLFPHKDAPASRPIYPSRNESHRHAAMAGRFVGFSLDYALPSGSGNAYQGDSVTVTLTFHAVQSSSNALPADCAAGQQCNTNHHASTFQWN